MQISFVCDDWIWGLIGGACGQINESAEAYVQHIKITGQI